MILHAQDLCPRTPTPTTKWHRGYRRQGGNSISSGISVYWGENGEMGQLHLHPQPNQALCCSNFGLAFPTNQSGCHHLVPRKSPLLFQRFNFPSQGQRHHGVHLRNKSRIRTTTSITCSAKLDSESATVQEKCVSVILLAGGKGKRMGASMPKQYLPLLGQPIALYSLYTFSRMNEVKEIIIVCDPSYEDIFEETKDKINVNLKFTLPGKERQDSVFSGLQAVDLNSQLVCIHDSARPLVSPGDVEKVLKDGWLTGAAVLGVPVKATIKEANSQSFVARTLDRKTLWEMQTPQVIKPELLKKGFELVNREGLVVTDDVSIVEHLKHPVYITEGSYTNIKVTTPDDMLVAERILSMSCGESA